MAVTIGLDLGTCFSAVSFVSGSETMLLAPSTEHRPGRIPTAFFCRGGRTLAGTPALQQMHGPYAACGLEFIKKRCLEEDTFVLDGTEFTARDIVSAIVSYLMDGARFALVQQFHHQPGEELRAVITIPAGYGAGWQGLLQSALEDADVSLAAVLTEPEAAAFHALNRKLNPLPAGSQVLVYDLGGGTCDIALLRVTGDTDTPFEVLTQEGISCGGTDWDDQMRALLGRQILHQVTGKQRTAALRYLDSRDFRLLCQDAKEFLSDHDIFSEELEVENSICTVSVTRDAFERASASLLEATMDAVRLVTRDRGDIHTVVLSGGGSRMPQVLRRLQREFPRSDLRLIDPDTAVVSGAAEYASRPGQLLRRSFHSYGMLVQGPDGAMEIQNLIFKDQPLPASGSMETISAPGILLLPVYEGHATHEKRMPLDSGKHVLQARYRKFGSGRITLRQTLTLGSDGLLNLKTYDTDGKPVAGRVTSVW